MFKDFIDAKNEIRRDLNELGTTVFAGYQGMDHDKLDRDKFTTKELTNYGYVVTRPFVSHLQPVQPWADAEWEERLSGCRGAPVNPGEAWKLRPEIWTPLLEHREGFPSQSQFSYTYSERLAASVPHAIFELYEHPTSRQVYVSVWDPSKDGPSVGKRRVPCSLGYHFLFRNGALHVTYYMRSSDFSTHFDNDIYLALKLATFMADRIDQPLGSFTHVINSLHVYAADVAGVF